MDKAVCDAVKYLQDDVALCPSNVQGRLELLASQGGLRDVPSGV